MILAALAAHELSRENLPEGCLINFPTRNRCFYVLRAETHGRARSAMPKPEKDVPAEA